MIGSRDGSEPERARGQTLNDYLLGVILLVVTLAGTFAMVPGLFQPFQEPVDTQESAVAERVGDSLIENYSVAGSQNTLNFTQFDRALSPSNFQWVLNDTGVLDNRQLVNVTVGNATFAGSRVRSPYPAGGSTFYSNTSVSATVVRYVDFDGSAPGGVNCNPACKIIVRVWQ